jgi:hypothetical protein
MRLSEIRDEDGTLPEFAWQGGYAIAYIADDGGMLCAACANEHGHERQDEPDGFLLRGYQTADWHDIGEGDWTCDHCEKVIDPEPEA